jgi:hypothetical protein
MIYKSSLNHKGNRATFKDVFFACLIIVFQVFDGFSFPQFEPPRPTLEGHTSDSFLHLLQRFNFLWVLKL